MHLCTLTERVARPPRAVFDYMVDWRKAPRWRYLVVAMMPLDDGPPRPGLRLKVAYQAGGVSREQEFTMTACEPPLGYTLEARCPDRVTTIRYTCEPDGGATRVVMAVSVQPHRLGTRLMLWLIRRSTARRFARQLAALRRELERDAAA